MAIAPKEGHMSDLRTAFDRAMARIKTFSAALEEAIGNGAGTLTDSAESAVLEWVDAHSLCRCLLQDASSSDGSAARAVLLSQGRVLMEQLVRAANTTVGAESRAQLRKLGGQLIRMSTLPIDDGERAARGREPSSR